MPPVRFVYEPALSAYTLSESHPFKPIRLELTRSLLHALGLLSAEQEVPPLPLDEALLYSVHDSRYIEAVKAVSEGKRVPQAYTYGLGTADNPIFPHMHAIVVRVCAATVTAVELVASGQAERALNLAGGLHHALANKASGFCIYNDLALGITYAVARYGWRVAYLDLDVHHGDGVQWLFYERPEVMTISLHESGRYLFPGTGHTFELGKGAGRGTSVNVPLEPFTEDDSFLECFEAVVPAALEAFRPDLIVLQAGADMHRYDPLADLVLSTHAFWQSYRRVSELADRYCQGRLVATGGGGYDPYRTVPRVWALLWAALSRQPAPEGIPEAWRARWQPLSPDPLPSSIFDDTRTWPPIARRAEIASYNRAVAARVLDALLPIWQSQGG